MIFNLENDRIVSNPSLLGLKLDALKTYKENLNTLDFLHSFSCNYHGICLNLKTKSLKIIEEIKNIIPSSWICPISNVNPIYIMEPFEFGYTSEFWSDEFAQDCFSLECNSITIQRDFASSIGTNEILLICDNMVGDGFYNFLRWYLSEKLIDTGKYVVHASCVLDKEDQAHLFLGHSGAGKTTITQLASPRRVLGDDMNLLSFTSGTLFVEAAAIGGQFNSMIGYDKKMPVKACYWLKQAPANSCYELSALMGNQKLLASFANLYWPEMCYEKIEQLLDFSTRVSGAVKFYELNFVNSPSIWRMLDP